MMMSQGTNVSMAYVEKPSAKAGTELILQVKIKNFKKFNIICLTKLQESMTNYEPGEGQGNSSDSDQDAVCPNQLLCWQINDWKFIQQARGPEGPARWER